MSIYDQIANPKVADVAGNYLQGRGSALALEKARLDLANTEAQIAARDVKLKDYQNEQVGKKRAKQLYNVLSYAKALPSVDAQKSYIAEHVKSIGGYEGKAADAIESILQLPDDQFKQAAGKVYLHSMQAAGINPRDVKPVVIANPSSNTGYSYSRPNDSIGQDAPSPKYTGAGVVISPELQDAIRFGLVDPKRLNSKTTGIYNQLAIKGALNANSSGLPSSALVDSINNGTIDPSKITSRTVGIWNRLAEARVNATAASADIAAKRKAYGDATQYAGLTARVVKTLDYTMPLLYGLADKVNKSGIPIIDNGFTSIRAKTTNNPSVIKYVSLLKTLRTEYANMMAKGNSSQITDAVRKEATEAVPSGLSSDAYRALGGQLKTEAKLIIKAANDTALSIKFGGAGVEPPISNIDESGGDGSGGNGNSGDFVFKGWK